MAFGKRIKQLREEKKLTQSQLGELLGISGRVLSYYEAESRFPHDEKCLIKIADFFSVSVDWLLNRTEIRTLGNNTENELIINIGSLSSDSVKKIQEYTEMVTQFDISNK